MFFRSKTCFWNIFDLIFFLFELKFQYQLSVIIKHWQYWLATRPPDMIGFLTHIILLLSLVLTLLFNFWLSLLVLASKWMERMTVICYKSHLLTFDLWFQGHISEFRQPFLIQTIFFFTFWPGLLVFLKYKLMTVKCSTPQSLIHHIDLWPQGQLKDYKSGLYRLHLSGFSNKGSYIGKNT